MFRWLAPRRTIAATHEPIPLRAEPGHRLYAIGDIHGRADLLQPIIDWIDRDAMATPGVIKTEIILGDIVDRGPGSRRVIELLSARAADRTRIVLRGNHEELFLRFLDDPEHLGRWLQLGGFETLMSYGIARRPIRSSADAKEVWLEASRKIPSEHVDFLRSTIHYHAQGELLFVHAGIRPGVTLEHQSVRDLLWIREPFLSFAEGFGHHVVHGHTPVTKAEFHLNRTNLDTGAYASGRLSCLIIDEAGARITMTQPSAAG